MVAGSPPNAEPRAIAFFVPSEVGKIPCFFRLICYLLSSRSRDMNLGKKCFSASLVDLPNPISEAVQKVTWWDVSLL